MTTLKYSKGLIAATCACRRARQRVRVCLLVVRSVQPVKPAIWQRGWWLCNLGAPLGVPLHYKLYTRADARART